MNLEVALFVASLVRGVFSGWKAKLSVALEVLSDIKQVLQEDAGLALNDKTKILVKGISAADAHAAAQRLLIADPSLVHLSPLLSPRLLR